MFDLQVDRSETQLEWTVCKVPPDDPRVPFAGAILFFYSSIHKHHVIAHHRCHCAFQTCFYECNFRSRKYCRESVGVGASSLFEYLHPVIWRVEKGKANEEEQFLPLQTSSTWKFISSRCWRRLREAGKLHFVVKQIALGYRGGWEEIAPGRFNPTHCACTSPKMMLLLFVSCCWREKLWKTKVELRPDPRQVFWCWVFKKTLETRTKRDVPLL